MKKNKPVRIDYLMVERGQATSLDRARALILAGEVFVSHERIDSGARTVSPDTEVVVRGGIQFVSRGGLKLEEALKTFSLDVRDQVCADVGAATGGFSDALLQRGAARVYAVDVGYGDLHWKVRSDPRVTPIERTNARYLEILPERVSLVAVDVSFISVALLFDNFGKWLVVGGDLVVLVKPQFEAVQEEVNQGQGIVTDTEVHRRVLSQVMADAIRTGFLVGGLIRSPILGVHGNAEFLLWLKNGGEARGCDPNQLISSLFSDAKAQ
jgi:23S rRNA (cytidine1920-2'-O)/16S rRNA (cytidine1409-2'-O)-methyltransferase